MSHNIVVLSNLPAPRLPSAYDFLICVSFHYPAGVTGSNLKGLKGGNLRHLG